MRILPIKNPIECKIVKRLNRFVVEIAVDGRIALAHINNTGRLEEYLFKGNTGFCFKNEKTGKTEYRLFAIVEGNMGAIIDTQLQMRTFEILVEKGKIPWLAGCKILRRNAKLKNSLIDYLLRGGSKNIYLEVKSAALRIGGYASYPDCPSLRGRKHIRELTEYVEEGGEAIILFIAAVPGVSAFKPNNSADPALCKLLAVAYKTGVTIKSIGIYYNHKSSSIYLDNSDIKTLI